MNRAELTKLVKEVFELKTNDVAKEKLSLFEEKLEEVILSGDEYTLCGIKVGSKVKEASSGEVNGKTWSKPEHKVPTAKPMKSLKDKLAPELAK